MSSSKFIRRLKSLIFITTSGTGLMFGYCFYKNDESFFKTIAIPTLRLFDAERAHEIAVWACKWKILPSVDYKDPETLVKNLIKLAQK